LALHDALLRRVEPNVIGIDQDYGRHHTEVQVIDHCMCIAVLVPALHLIFDILNVSPSFTVRCHIFNGLLDRGVRLTQKKPVSRYISEDAPHVSGGAGS